MRQKVQDFALSGILNWIVEAGLFNLFLLYAGMSSPLAKFLGAAVATFTSYLCLRYWVFRKERAKDPSRELPSFIVVNVLAALLMSGVTYLGNLVISETDFVLENALANGLAVGLAMVFRFLCYTKFVFKSSPDPGPKTN